MLYRIYIFELSDTWKVIRLTQCHHPHRSVNDLDQRRRRWSRSFPSLSGWWHTQIAVNSILIWPRIAHEDISIIMGFGHLFGTLFSNIQVPKKRPKWSIELRDLRCQLTAISVWFDFDLTSILTLNWHWLDGDRRVKTPRYSEPFSARFMLFAEYRFKVNSISI